MSGEYVGPEIILSMSPKMVRVLSAVLEGTDTDVRPSFLQDIKDGVDRALKAYDAIK